MKRGAQSAFDECMRMEFRIVSRVVYGHDLYEGVRAVIVDKDNAPRWQPGSLAAVTDTEVARHFETLGKDELVLS
jgi:enoyl-CoA hydratase